MAQTEAPTITRRRWLVDDTDRPYMARFRLSDDGTRIVSEMYDPDRWDWVAFKHQYAWTPTVKRVEMWASLVKEPDETVEDVT